MSMRKPMRTGSNSRPWGALDMADSYHSQSPEFDDFLAHSRYVRWRLQEGGTAMGPLSGIKVVEMGVFVAGPAAAAVLGDWGADVVKIENPAGGDPIRALVSLGLVPIE